MVALLLLLACGSGAPEVPRPAPDVDGKVDLDVPPVGSIGGEPILPAPVVLGGISTEDVEAGIAAQMEAIAACYDPSVAPASGGKVLIKFTIGPDGAVASSETRSTSLRHPPTEQCVNERVSRARFAPLASGRLAIVHYPFAFPSAP